MVLLSRISDRRIHERSEVREAIGGRDGGYRGYSIKNDVTAGKWRVNVKTGDGKLIGRVGFTVEDVQRRATTTLEMR